MKSDNCILIPCAGAVDRLLAVILSTACRVHAVCREAGAKASRDRVFSLTNIHGDVNRFSAPVVVFRGPRSDHLIITSMSKDTAAICRDVDPFIREMVTVRLQNGIGNEEINLIRFSESQFERGGTS